MNQLFAKRLFAMGFLTMLVPARRHAITAGIVTLITTEIAIVMIVTLAETTTAAMTGIETGIGAIATAATGIVIDSGSRRQA